MRSIHHTGYLNLLWNSTRLSSPLDVAVYAMLTMLLTPYELLHPQTRIEDGCLLVPAGRERIVPLGEAAQRLTQGADGPLRVLLGIDHERRWGVGELRSTYAEEVGDGGPLLEQLSVMALDHQVRAGSDQRIRIAALSYAGLALASSPNDLGHVARLIDQAVRAAGLNSEL